MEITDLEIVRLRGSRRSTFLIVLLRAGADAVGLGEASMSLDDAAVAGQAQRLFASHVRGRRLSDWGALVGDLIAVAGRTPELNLASAVSAMEQAVIDLRAQQVGVPLSDLLGGARRSEVAVYANLNRGISDRSPSGFADAARDAVAAGFETVKIAPFEEVVPGAMSTGPPEPSTDRGLARVAAVRAAIGPDRGLLVDCHGRFHLAQALDVAGRLVEHGVGWFEEPVPSTPLLHVLSGIDSGSARQAEAGELRSIAESSPLPLAGGEYVFGMAQASTLLRDLRPAYLMPDVKHCGGVLAASRIAALAASRGVAVAPHNPSGPVGTFASAHVAAAAERFHLLEYAYGDVPWRGELTEPGEEITGGRLRVPEGAGLGVRLNEALVQHYQIPIED